MLFTVTMTVGMVSKTATRATREAAETCGNEWMVEQRSMVDEEVAAGNPESAEIPFHFTVS